MTGARISPNPTGRAVTCTAHCSACGRHFHSTKSFDAHRVGSYAAPVGSERGRRCISPEHDQNAMDANGESKFCGLTTEGRCETYAAVKHGVTVWTLRASVEAARAQWARNGTPGAPISAVRATPGARGSQASVGASAGATGGFAP